MILRYEFVRDISSHAEIRVLVNGTGDQALDVLLGSKNGGERGRKGRSGLDCWEHDFSNVGAVIKPKDSFDLRRSEIVRELKQL